MDVAVKGSPVRICLNRHYLARALRFGLNEIHIIDELSPLTFKAGGKKLIVMPIRLEGPATVKPKEERAGEAAQPTQAAPSSEPANPTPPPQEITTNNPAPTTVEPANNHNANERNNMAKNNTPTDNHQHQH